MNLMSPRVLMQLLASTLRAPRETFAGLLALRLDRATLWQALLLVVVLSMLLAVLGGVFLAVSQGGTTPPPEQPFVMLSPLVIGLVQLAVLVVSVFLIDWVGRRFRGTGDLGGAILVVTWLQFVMVCLQVIQTLLILVAPGLAGVVTLLGMVLFFWLMTNFIAQLHGFTSLGRVFGMILFVMVGVALGLSLLLTLAGVTVPR